MAANDLEQVLGSRGSAQDHLAAKGCLGFVILLSPEGSTIDDALNYGNTEGNPMFGASLVQHMLTKDRNKTSETF